VTDPVEIVTPVLRVDNVWARTIDGFWAAMHSDFEFRQDTTCGFHIHISLHSGQFALPELKNMAKAVAF